MSMDSCGDPTLIAYGELRRHEVSWRWGNSRCRIDYSPDYRFYYALSKNELILLLIGGDKSSQQRDIAKAKKLNQEYE